MLSDTSQRPLPTGPILLVLRLLGDPDAPPASIWWSPPLLLQAGLPTGLASC